MDFNEIYYTKPPSKLKLKRPTYLDYRNIWEQASLPLGNGTMGLTVLGEVKKDKITFNHKTLWTGGPSAVRPDYCGGNINKPDKSGKMPYEYYEQIREEFKKGNNEKASELCEKLVGIKEGYGAYQCWGNLLLTFDSIKRVSSYRRSLKMDKSICEVSYNAKLKSGETVTDKREYFVSHPDNCCAIKIVRDGGILDLYLSFSTEHKAHIEYNNDGTFIHRGELSDNGLKFCLCGKLITDGKIEADSNGFKISDAKELTFIFTSDTDYMDAYPSYRTGESEQSLFEKVSSILSAACCKSYNELKQNHINDFNELYSRVKLDLNGERNREADTLINKYKNNSASDKRTAEEILYNLGRYFMISSSRENDILPSNLQGIWNCTNSPIWSSDFHLNINLQMNYWPAFNGNLHECAKPLIRYIRSQTVPGRLTAKYYTNVESTDTEHNGFLFHTQNTPFGWTCPGWSFDWGWSPAAVPWILHNIYEYYEYTLDKNVLREDIYPMLKETAGYFEKLLTPYEGKLVTSPCYSPEHGPRTMGNTYEQALIYQLYKDVLAASKALNVDSDLAKKWESIKKQLKPYEIGESGQIKEWYNEKELGKIGEKHHRHMSHLLGLFPCDVINWYENPEFIEAAKVSMNHRTDASTGWSMGQKINTWARVGDGDRVLKIIGTLLNKGIYTNFWDFHPPFQIDGNFGFTSGVNEMLMQSHCGFIHLLPALPHDWSKGSVSGLIARGNFKVQIKWKKNTLTEALIMANSTGVLKVYYGESEFILDGTESTNHFAQIEAEKGKTYKVILK